MGDLIRVRNPRTGERDYQFERISDEELDGLTGRLRSGQKAWAEKPPEERAAVLMQWGDELRRARAELEEALFLDTGRIHETVLEVDGTLRTLEHWCRRAPELLRQAAGSRTETGVPFIEVGAQDVPIPLVGVISPWNFPMLLSLIDAIPALLTGCAAVVKPSTVTPRFAEPLMRTVEKVPELVSVLGYALGDGRRTGPALIRRVDTVVFTGSVPTGLKVAEVAAEQLIPAFLELGGKDAAVVLDDADIERTTASLSWGSMTNAGQSCLSIERAYVDRKIFEPFVERLTQRVGALRLASGDDPRQGEIGPIIEEGQAHVIREQLEEALARGAKAECGGRVEEIGGGLWCHPTVLTGVDHSMKVIQEETFGPVLPVLPFGGDDEGVELANDSPYGLSGAVFSGSAERALAAARRMDAGAISINDCALTAFIHEGEKQSFKKSGVGGSRMGVASLRRFVRRKALIHNTALAWDPWWYAKR